MVEQLSEAQIALFQEAFSWYDKDHDGKIKASEMGDVMRALKQTPTGSDLKSFEAECGDQIDFAEFLAFIARVVQQGGIFGCFCFSF